MKKRKMLSSLLVFLCMCTAGSNSDTKVNDIRINQIGYYPKSVKRFIVVNSEATTFKIKNSEKETVFSGELEDRGIWDKSNEHAKSGDFSSLTTLGEYTIHVSDKAPSYTFKIDTDLYDKALDASVKSFYFQRNTFEIEEQFGGIYARAAGHPDTCCLYHPSTGRTEGCKNSPYGWYDAGDYGKYIVNAGITVNTMLALHELFSNAIGDDLNIPESGNGVNDLLDEIKFEMDWVLTMQDDDGGVFHKLTTLGFAGFVMPKDAPTQRYFIGKATTTTLSFATICAQFARVYKDIDSEFSHKCLKAAEKSWKWALKNPAIEYKNPEDVHTGPYGDKDFDLKFFSAATELFITTGKKEYSNFLKKNHIEFDFRPEESWRNVVHNIAYYSLINTENKLSKKHVEKYTKSMIKTADKLLADLEANPYRQPLERFKWGSSSDVLNMSLVFANAYHHTKEQKYFDAMIETVDYIFGKNATGYSMLTGYGTKQAMFIHHRPSAADGIEAPIPGFVVGGPNDDRQDDKAKSEWGVPYPKENLFPAKSYVDLEGSYASNEICLNWNAPLVYILGFIESNKDMLQ